jgi:serine protease Do
MENNQILIRRWVGVLVLVAALIGGAVLATGLRNWSGISVMGASNVPVTVDRNTSPVPLGNFANGFASVLKPALPAVVNIHSSKVVKQRQGMPFFNDPMFKQFFGDQFNDQQMKPQKEESLGSGVIITADGTILTNNHVIDGASDIKVDLADRREFKAKLVGTDPKTDVAVLKIEASGLPTLPFGDSTKIQVGDVVFAIGDPFAVGETATMGIVSATGRSIGIEGPHGYEDFIQTDAAINPGNSGGAMIDLHGDLIGINTAIETGGSEGNVGIGFAIPINMAKSVMDQLVAHGKVVRGSLGVYIQNVDAGLAKSFGLPSAEGVLIGDVIPDTPASRANLQKGDIILKVNGEPVNDRTQLSLKISQMAPGTSVQLEIWRNGKSQMVTATLTDLAAQEAKEGNNGDESDQDNGGNPNGDNSSALAGVSVQNLTPDITQELNLPSTTHGVVVTQVDPSSAAAESGVIRRGTVIQEVNHKPVSNISQYKQALAGAQGTVLLLVNNGGVTQYATIEVQTH